MSKPHVDAARRWVSTHVAKRVNCPRPAGIRAYFALTSPRLVTSRMSKPHVDAARRWVSTHVAKGVDRPRAAGIRALTSPRLATSGMSKTPCGRRPEAGFNTCSETSELSACCRYSCLFCNHITSFSHIRNVETPCGRRPEAGFNTCSETSELSACRRYSCLILQSHHLASSHMSASLAPKRVTETVFDNTSIRTTGLALQPENDAVTKISHSQCKRSIP